MIFFFSNMQSGYAYVVVWVGGLEVWEISVFEVFYFNIKVYNFMKNCKLIFYFIIIILIILFSY